VCNPQSTYMVGSAPPALSSKGLGAAAQRVLVCTTTVPPNPSANAVARG
jgi:hypothetical protein